MRGHAIVDVFRGIWRDLVHATRSLARARAFTFVCVLTLGIGMTPVIAIQYWSRVFTTPPRTVDPDRPTALVEIFTTRVGPHAPTARWSYPDFVDLRDAPTGISLTGWVMGDSGVIVPDSTVKKTVPAMFVSSSYFRTIGVSLTRGAGFSSDTADPVVIVSDAFWQTRLGADPAVVGKTLVVDGVSHVVAGIGPKAFGGHLPFQAVELFLPLERYPRLLADPNARFDRRTEWVRIHGRLADGVAVAQASAAVSAITAGLARAYPATNEFRAGIVAPYDPIGNLEGEDLPIVMALWRAMTAFPLIVVCLNVSGMMQVRSAMRERELSIRQAIGASRGRLMQHLLVEAVVLSALGLSLASIVLFNVPPLVAWWIGEPLPVELAAALDLDLSTIAVCGGLCLAASLLFGWLPAARFSRPVIMTVLKDEAHGGGLRAGRVHRVTSALQVAVAVPLLVLGATSLEQVRATATSDLGFAAGQIYAAPLELDAVDGENGGFKIRTVREALARTSGVVSATVADGLPLDFRYRLARVSSQIDASAAPRVAMAHVTRVGDEYLNTMGIALERGRAFTIDDTVGAPMVTIVSRALADTLFPDLDALGRQFTLAAPNDDGRAPQTLTIVGVTDDFPTSQMTTDREQLLLPLAQHPNVQKDSVPVSDDRQGATMLMLVARSAAGDPPAKLTAALENAIRGVNQDFDRTGIVTGVWLRNRSMDDFLNRAAFAGVGGSVILLLAALGIYGVVGLMVATRTREIAVRMTLGASRLRVLVMILFDVVKLAAPGVAIGVGVAVAVDRLGGGVTVSPIEPFAYLAGAVIATLTAVVASFAPARRAASVDPMAAMRST
jgi:predicted permease